MHIDKRDNFLLFFYRHDPAQLILVAGLRIKIQNTKYYRQLYDTRYEIQSTPSYEQIGCEYSYEY